MQQEVLSMFSPHEISHIRERVNKGTAPGKIAEEMGLGRTTFLQRLYESGYKIVTERRLQVIEVVRESDTNPVSSGHL
jgi:hypothetical protein